MKLSTFAIFIMNMVYAQLHSSDKEIIERLTRLEERIIRLEEGQKALNQRIDDLHRLIEIRLDAVNKRIDDVNKRIDDVNKRIDDIRGLLYVLLAAIFAFIGLVIWDRRKTLAPVVKKTKELEISDEMILRALKEYAKKEPKFAEVLKYFTL